MVAGEGCDVRPAGDARQSGLAATANQHETRKFQRHKIPKRAALPGIEPETCIHVANLGAEGGT